MAVSIATALMARLVELAGASPDAEICGLLTGDGSDRIIGIVSTVNVAADPQRRFEVNPTTLFAALRAERGGGPRIVGHYHSHPNGDAAPSLRDAEASGSAGMLWLIIGREARLWRAVAGGPMLDAFEPVALRIDGVAIARNAASRHKGTELGQLRG